MQVQLQLMSEAPVATRALVATWAWFFLRVGCARWKDKNIEPRMVAARIGCHGAWYTHCMLSDAPDPPPGQLHVRGSPPAPQGTKAPGKDLGDAAPARHHYVHRGSCHGYACQGACTVAP